MASAAPTPRRLVVDRDAPDGATMRAAGRVLAAGGLVVYPTDTLYGLAADPRDAEAVARLVRVKGRPAGAALPLIAADRHQARAAAGRLTPLALRLMDAFWPGPLAVVVDAAAALDPRVVGAGGSVAVRVPAHAVARALAGALGHAVTATSANPSGGTAPATAAEAGAGLGTGIDVLIDAGPAPGGAPSTLVDARGDRPLLLREGAVPWGRVLQSTA